MGFIGFKSVDDAALAMKYYNKSYMDTMRLEVEVCACDQVAGQVSGQEARLVTPHQCRTTDGNYRTRADRFERILQPLPYI